MIRWRIVAPDGLHKEAIEILKRHQWADLDVCSEASADEKFKKMNDSDFVIVRSATKIHRELLSTSTRIKGVIRAGVGIDNIDLKAADEFGIRVWNAPNGNYQSAAEIAIALMFALARGIGPAYEAGRQQKWIKNELSSAGRQLMGSSLGLFGAGNIGKKVAKMAWGIGMKVVICDPYFVKDLDHPFESVTFETLLASSDFISIHAPLLDSTKKIFSRSAFQAMKNSSFLINAARGGIVDEEALLWALENNQISGAALDVFEKEPFEGSFYTKLLACPKLITTPHIGASTKEAQRLVGLECAYLIEQIWASSQGGSVQTPPKTLNSPQNPRNY